MLFRSEANIRLGAGRALLTNDGETAFNAGASATITGNMLTTVACATIRSDRQMLQGMGRDVTPPYQPASAPISGTEAADTEVQTQEA